MAVSIRLDEDLEVSARAASKAHRRSLAKQVSYWADIGRIAEEYPDLPFEVIRNILQGAAELDAGKELPYQPGKGEKLEIS